MDRPTRMRAKNLQLPVETDLESIEEALTLLSSISFCLVSFYSFVTKTQYLSKAIQMQSQKKQHKRIQVMNFLFLHVI
jgi:hypothetical protein